MDILDLPLLRSKNTLEDAFQAMQRAGVHAIVIEAGPGEYTLYLNRDIGNGFTKGKKLLKELRGVGLPAPPLGAFEDKVRSALGPLATATEEALAADPHVHHGIHESVIGSALDALGAQYAVLTARDREVRLVTRHESQADEVRAAPLVCACSVDRQHQPVRTPTTPGTPCDFCDGQYECI